MMLGSVLTALYVICTLYAAANGTAEATGRALMEGAQAAVPFVLGIAGGICLWSGVLELLERCGGSFPDPRNAGRSWRPSRKISAPISWDWATPPPPPGSGPPEAWRSWESLPGTSWGCWWC